MTAIAALEVPGGVWIAWDSCVATDSDQDLIADKVWSAQGYVIGASGTLRFIEVLKYHLPTVPRRGRTGPERWASRELIPRMRSAVIECQVWDDVPADDRGGELLLVVGGKILRVESDWACYRSLHGYACAGNGAAVAVGALSALTMALPESDPQQRVVAAVRAAVRHVPGVTEPVRSMWIAG